MTLRTIADSLLKLLGIDSNGAVAVQTGYRNEAGERTQTGIHIFLNFLEDKMGTEFYAWLKDKRDAAVKAEKEAKNS